MTLFQRLGLLLFILGLVALLHELMTNLAEPVMIVGAILFLIASRDIGPG